MRSPVKALLVFAVLLLGAAGKPSSHRKIDRIRPVVQSIRVVRNLDEVVKVDSNEEAAADNTSKTNSPVQLTDEEIRKQVAEHPDRPPMLTDDVIYSDKTKFTTYTEDDGDVHIAIRIPGDTGLNVGVAENGPDPNFPEEEVVNPEIEKIDEEDAPKEADDEEAENDVDVTPPLVLVGEDSNESEDYVDPDTDNNESSDTVIVTDENADNSEENTSTSEEQPDRNTKTEITNVEYEDPEAEDPSKPEEDSASDSEENEVVPAPAPNPTENNENEAETQTSTKSTTKTEQPKETTEKEGSYDKMISLTKGIESGGLSLFWIFAILFCCFI